MSEEEKSIVSNTFQSFHPFPGWWQIAEIRPKVVTSNIDTPHVVNSWQKKKDSTVNFFQDYWLTILHRTTKMFIVLGLTPIKTCGVWSYSIMYALIWVWPCAHNLLLKKKQSVIMYYTDLRARLSKTVILPKLLNESVSIWIDGKHFFEGVKHFLSRPSPKPKFINIYDEKRISSALRVYHGLRILSLL